MRYDFCDWCQEQIIVKKEKRVVRFCSKGCEEKFFEGMPESSKQ